MKIRVNQEACIGCGACQALVPDIFEIDDNGLAIAKDVKIDEELKDEVIDAVEGCPTSAIEEIDEELKDEVIDAVEGCPTSTIEEIEEEKN